MSTRNDDSDAEIGPEVGPDDLETGKNLKPSTETSVPRDRETDPDIRRPHPEELKLSETVALRLDEFETRQKKQGKMLHKLYDLVAGKNSSVSGTSGGGLVRAFEDVNSHLSAIRAGIDNMVALSTNEVLALRKEHNDLAVKVGTLEAEVTLLGQALLERGAEISSAKQ